MKTKLDEGQTRAEGGPDRAGGLSEQLIEQAQILANLQAYHGGPNLENTQEILLKAAEEFGQLYVTIGKAVRRAKAAEAREVKMREALEGAKALILHTFGTAEVKPREWPSPATALHRIDQALQDKSDG